MTQKVEIQDLPPSCRPAPGSQKLWAIYRLGTPPVRLGFPYWDACKDAGIRRAERYAKQDFGRKYVFLAFIAPIIDGCLHQKH